MSSSLTLCVYIVGVTVLFFFHRTRKTSVYRTFLMMNSTVYVRCVM